MPVPIKPLHGMGYRKENGSLLDSIDLTMLGDFIPLPSPKSKIVTASDRDANLLLNLWQKKSEKNDEINVKGMDNNDILRLKTSGFLTGDVERVKFTQKAKTIITTMVLNEPNAFSDKKQPKGYNEILASQNKKFKGSRLPKFASSNLMSLAAAVPNKPIPDGLKQPSHSDYYIWEQRATNTNGRYAEYTIRVYLQNGAYHVWAFNGRIGQGQTLQYKGHSVDYKIAISLAQTILGQKTSETLGGYNQSTSPLYVQDPNPSNKPGKKLPSNISAADVFLGQQSKAPSIKPVTKPTMPPPLVPKSEPPKSKPQLTPEPVKEPTIPLEEIKDMASNIGDLFD